MKADRTLAIALAALLVSAGLAGVVAATDDRDRTAEHEPVAERIDRVLDALAERYDLTDGEVAEIERLIADMRADGAPVTEIREAVRERLVAFGIPEADLPGADRPGTDRPAPLDGDGRLAWTAEYLGLTDEQVTELRETAEAERADGAYPAEIRVAVLEQLRSYGYTDAELVEARDAYRIHRLDERFDLTDEQVTTLGTTAAELREEDAMDVEVRAAMLGDLQAFGVVPEEYPSDRDGRHGAHHRHGGQGHGHAPGHAHEGVRGPRVTTGAPD